MKKSNVLQIVLAAGIVSTGLFTSADEIKAESKIIGMTKQEEIRVNNSKIPNGFPKNVGQLYDRMLLVKYSIQDRYKHRYGFKKVVVTTEHDSVYTLYLDGSYNLKRNVDLIDGRPKSLVFTFGDDSQIKGTKKDLSRKGWMFQEVTK